MKRPRPDPAAELSSLREKFAVASRILRTDAERETGEHAVGVAIGKLRGAEWIDAILRGDFDPLDARRKRARKR